MKQLDDSTRDLGTGKRYSKKSLQTRWRASVRFAYEVFDDLSARTKRQAEEFKAEEEMIAREAAQAESTSLKRSVADDGASRRMCAALSL